MHISVSSHMSHVGGAHTAIGMRRKITRTTPLSSLFAVADGPVRSSDIGANNDDKLRSEECRE